MNESQKRKIASRNLVLFVIGKLTATLGSTVYTFAISLYILKVTGSAMSFSISLLCSTLPRVILGPFSGVVSDRFNRKRIIVTTDIASALIAGGLFLVFTELSNEVIVLYIASILLNTVSVFYSTAITSAIPNMINEERIQQVSGINQAIVSLSGMLGPVIGGLLFAFVSLPMFMVINTCTFLLSALTAILIDYNLYAEKKKEHDGVLKSLKEGFMYIKGHPFLGTLIQVALILNFLFAALMVYLPYIAVTIRDLSSEKFGFIEASIACGTFLSAIILSRLPEFKNKNRAVFTSVALMGWLVGMIGLAASTLFSETGHSVVFLYLIVICFLLGMLMMVTNIPIFVLLQKETPDEYRGRVMGFLETGASGITPIGFLLFGGIVTYVSPVYTLVVIGGIQILISCYYLKNNVLEIKEHEVSAEVR